MMNLTESNFQNEVLDSSNVVLVDFWAPWCGPCRMLAPVLEQIADEYNGKIKGVKVNVDENPALASEYNVMSIPTMVVFKNGAKQDQFVGALPKTTIINKLEPWIWIWGTGKL